MFYAHSTKNPIRQDWQPLFAHLEEVSRLSRLFARRFGAEKWGHAAGLLHDIGKYSEAYQKRISNEGGRVDHSTAGAQLAIERYGRPGRLLAYAIAGHHAGLANGQGEGDRRTVLEQRLKYDDLPDYSAWQNEIALPDLSELRLPQLRLHPDEAIARERNGFRVAFFVRMLFSCLVDADFLDTEAFYDRVEGRERRRGWPKDTLLRMKVALDHHLVELQDKAERNDVNRERAKVLAHVREQAAQAPGLFTFTVPTGGGKTLSSLAFALEHALCRGLDRIIYVIPFTSIIEQTASVFRKALAGHGDAVVEHHSAFNEDGFLDAMKKLGNKERGLEARDKLKLASENWDAPIIVTTAVQFFESLFSARPSRCRKLHNITRSVVILDEAQTLPVTFLKPCVAALDELSRNYGTSVILCTATQPALIQPDSKDSKEIPGIVGGFPACEVREIAPEPRRLFEALRRVTILCEPEPLSDEAIAERLLKEKQALCIVGTRRHARELFEKIALEEGTYHLSALMCAAHRQERLAEIKDTLKASAPCRLITTTVVEAGVDVDFPVVFRAMAGLDSIAQAAGRCNREGRNPAKTSRVVVFEPEGREPVTELRPFADAGRETLRHHGEDPLSMTAIEDYFQRVYWLHQSGEQDRLDAKGIIERLDEQSRDLWLPFEDIERDFRLIESSMRPVIIPWDEKARELIEKLKAFENGAPKPGMRVSDIARGLQRYTVNVPERGYTQLRPVLEPMAERMFADQFMVLSNMDIYSRDAGLRYDDPTARSAQGLVV